MAGLLDIFGTGGTETLSLLGMSPADIQRNRDDAQAQALYGLAARLFQGGNTGQSIAEGLQQGQKLYSAAMQNQLQDQLQGFQLKDLLRKRKLEEEATARQAMIDRAVAGAYRPAVAGAPAQMVEEEGRYIGETPAVAAQPAMLDLNSIAPILMTSREGQARLETLSDLIPKMRKAGIGVEKTLEDNPFAVFTQDETIPKNIKTLATQYSKSWSSGRLDPDVADKRVAELSAMAQRAQETDQRAQDRQTAMEQNRQMQQQLIALRQQGLAQSAQAQALTAEIARSNLAIREADAAAKAEERQKPVTEAKESLNLINQAEKLLDTATGSLTGTAVDVVAGSFGKSTAGAQAASKLKAIQGALVAKMPKMSGPQSDKDVLLYREMAGQIGDSTLPVETRKAAIETLREIQERYAKVEPGSSKPAPEPTSPFKYDPAKEQRYQQWLKSQGK